MALLLVPDVSISSALLSEVEIADILAGVTVDGVPLAETPYTARVERSSPHDDLFLLDGLRAYVHPQATYGSYQQGIQVILENGDLPPPPLDEGSDEYGVITLSYLDPGGCSVPVCSCTVPYCPPPPSPTVLTIVGNLPNLALGQVVSYQYTTENAVGAVTYAITSGALPAGLSMDSAGLVTGTTTTTTNYAWVVTATDADSNTDTLVDTAYVFGIMGDLPDSEVGPVDYQYTQSGGVGPVAYAIASGALPTGAIMDAEGHVDGVATTAGTYNWTVQGTDANGIVHTIADSAVITALPVQITGNLPDGYVGDAGTYQYVGSDGTAPLVFSITGGALPPGATMDANGLVTFNYTTDGSYSWEVTVTDANNLTATLDDTAVIAIVQITGNLPDAYVGDAGTYQYIGSGGLAPRTFAITGGSLPPGATMDADGLVTFDYTTDGLYSWQVTVTDANSETAVLNDTALISIVPVLGIEGDLPDGYSGDSGTYQYTAINGTAPFVFTISSGALPTGATMDSSGLVTYTYTAGGLYTWEVTVTDANSDTATLLDTAMIEGFELLPFYVSGSTSPVARRGSYVAPVTYASGIGNGSGGDERKSPRGGDFAASLYLGTLNAWKLNRATGTYASYPIVDNLTGIDYGSAFDMSRDGQWLVACDASVFYVFQNTGINFTRVATYPASLNWHFIAFNHDGTRFATLKSDTGACYQWSFNTTTGAIAFGSGISHSFVSSVAWSRDDRYLATINTQPYPGTGVLRIYDTNNLVTTMTLKASISAATGNRHAVCFNRDGTKVYYTSPTGTGLNEASFNGAALTLLNNYPLGDWPATLEVSPEGEYMVVAMYNSNARLYSIANHGYDAGLTLVSFFSSIGREGSWNDAYNRFTAS